MDNSAQDILTKLKASKQQGLTFYQATEQLKQQGYTPAQISDAADQFNYTAPIADTASGTGDNSQAVNSVQQLPASPTEGSELDKDYQKMGNDLLAEKDRDTRQYAYVGLAISAGLFGTQAYRLWLTTKFWGGGGNQHYLLAFNLGYYFLSGVISAGLAILALKFYFRFKDKKVQADT